MTNDSNDCFHPQEPSYVIRSLSSFPKGSTYYSSTLSTLINLIMSNNSAISLLVTATVLGITTVIIPPLVLVSDSSVQDLFANWNVSPENYFETCLVLLLIPGIFIFLKQNVLPYVVPRAKKDLSVAEKMVLSQTVKPSAIASFQLLYLPVFWLLRAAFWMSGPYFFPVYASKVIDGENISFGTIGNIFNSGFAIAALFLPVVANLVSSSFTDEKSGTIAAAVFYGVGAFSTQCNDLPTLFIGRGMGSIGSGLFGVMPEAWLSSEVQKDGSDPYGRWLGSTFATAFAFDSIVAIGAGKVATLAASNLGGPTGPFKISPIFLIISIIIVGLFWTDTDVPTGDNKEVKIVKYRPGKWDEVELSFKGAINIISSDVKMVMVGLIQSLFEAATYIFVLNQAPAIKTAAINYFGIDSIVIPSGIIFCCYMSCCLLGSNIYGYLIDNKYRPERVMTVFLMVAALSLVMSSMIISKTEETGLVELSIAFFVFEFCVGIYYPTISWLRSKYLPAKHRSIIMTIVNVPFNLLVLIISLSAKSFGTSGVWYIASFLVVLATLCLIQLQRIAKREAIENAPKTWKRVRAKWIAIARVLQIRRLVQGIAKQAAKENID